MTSSGDVLSVHEFQRLVFSTAVEFGWQGRHPLTLGDDEADQEFRNALRFLESLRERRQRSKGMRDGNAYS